MLKPMSGSRLSLSLVVIVSRMYNFSPVLNLVSPAAIFLPSADLKSPKHFYFSPILSYIYPPYSHIEAPRTRIKLSI